MLFFYFFFAYTASISNLGQLAAALSLGPLSSRLGGRRAAALLSVAAAAGFLGAAASRGGTAALAAARAAQGAAIACSVVQVMRQKELGKQYSQQLSSFYFSARGD